MCLVFWMRLNEVVLQVFAVDGGENDVFFSDYAVMYRVVAGVFV